MYLKEYLKQFGDKKIKIFVDMDGVIVDYVFGSPKDYDKKRPLFDSINKLKEISEMENIELFILSTPREEEGCQQKQEWLDKYAPFFKKENRIIISREARDMTKSSDIKIEYLNKVARDGTILIVIDDDPRIMKEIYKENEDIIILKDTVLVD